MKIAIKSIIVISCMMFIVGNVSSAWWKFGKTKAAKKKAEELSDNVEKSLLSDCAKYQGKGEPCLSTTTISSGSFSYCGQPGLPPVIIQNTQFDCSKRLNYVIDNCSDWQILWGMIHTGETPKPPVPLVDFTKCTILGVFYGQKPTSAYNISISSVVETENTVDVFVTESSPTGGVVLPVVTYPYHIIKIRKSNKSINFKSTARIAVPPH